MTPTPFEVAQPAPVREQPRTRGTAWVVPALIALALLAALVVFWLPGQVADTAPAPGDASAAGLPTAAAPASPAAQPAPEAPAVTASPWSDARQARLRKEAQEVLESLLDLQFALEERGVTSWAPTRYAHANDTAAAADELYRAREFDQAEAGYRRSLEQLQALQAAIPEELAAALARAETALEAGDQAAAETALDTAALLQPDSSELGALRARAALLPQLLPLLAEADTLEAAGDLAAAQQRLDEAVALDPAHRRAAAQRDRVALAYRQQRFNDAMSEGYGALDEGRFDAARSAFRRAASLHEGSAEAADALREVGAAETANTLATLRSTGLEHEKRERWAEAVATYRRALRTDNTLLFAREGLARAEPRAELDARLQAVLDNPGRLADTGVAQDTEVLLADARAIAPAGPRLEGQLRAIAELLRKANTPVDVTLRSDAETEVVVYKVARLGRFTERSLTLRPGTYTAVGSRNGYRDVRQQFTLEYGRDPEPVTIVCKERI
ncbi:MAG: hypothetical protein CME59_01875 [Halioglobus sp.]|nr:hypothetical protein [Halioglobus sp.]